MLNALMMLVGVGEWLLRLFLCLKLVFRDDVVLRLRPAGRAPAVGTACSQSTGFRRDLKPRKFAEFPSSSRGVDSESHRVNATDTAAARPANLRLQLWIIDM